MTFYEFKCKTAAKVDLTSFNLGQVINFFQT